jgi:hypothetical protein
MVGGGPTASGPARRQRRDHSNGSMETWVVTRRRSGRMAAGTAGGTIAVAQPFQAGN